MHQSILGGKDILGAVQKWGTAMAFLLFPAFFIAANLLHPNLLHPKALTNGAAWIEHFRGQSGLHLAHVLEFLSAPMLMIMAIQYMNRLRSRMPWLSFIGGMLAIFGALMLVGNKSALCLTLSAFDTLSDHQLAAMAPGLDVLLQRKGWLIILWFLPLLPLGFLLLGVALFRSAMVPRWQAVLIILGSAMLLNPEIEIINLAASIILMIAFLPYVFTLLKEDANGEKSSVSGPVCACSGMYPGSSAA